MSKIISLIITLVISLTLPACVTTGKQDASRPGIELSSTAKITATVEAIDHEKRLVTLRGPEGKQVVVEVSEEARNLDQVEVGDTVEVEYHESVALFAQLPDGEPANEVKVSTARAPLGNKPGAGVAETITMKATVEAIDYDTRMLVLRGPEGNTLTTKVDDRVTRFNEVKPGDEIVVQYTRAFAIAVREP
ncbi:MAG: hypothetical protein PVH54_01480 [Gammaproteobacteria bacterium]|jgi:hypothetical protein